MNDEWIKLSYEWTMGYTDYENVTQIDYLDILGLYETCMMIFDFDDIEDEKLYGYGK